MFMPKPCSGDFKLIICKVLIKKYFVCPLPTLHFWVGSVGRKKERQKMEKDVIVIIVIFVILPK